MGEADTGKSGGHVRGTVPPQREALPTGRRDSRDEFSLCRGDAQNDQRWRTRRLIDIFTVVGLLGLLWSGFHVLTETSNAPLKTSFIVPSQTTHW